MYIGVAKINAKNAEVTFEDLRALIQYKRIEKKIVPFSELVFGGGTAADVAGRGGDEFTLTSLPCKRAREEMGVSSSYI